ncbi:MAG TPA: phosphatidylinositol-specific phospholipase C1-like protein [Dehalococcoidia bacterium]|nr:phosphatidylinositol-specific phospholipase C1-like protein [Dehalococcoidia bacterium]
MRRIFIAMVAAMFAISFSAVDGFAQTSADQNCLGWEREMRSAAGYDDLGRPVLDRLDGDESHGQLLNSWVEDNCMRLNYTQVLGTHNSYHLQPRASILWLVSQYSPEEAMNMEYTHRPLAEQLELFGVRQVELDVFADPDGGRFAMPLGPLLVPPHVPDPIKPELLEPGLKVLHVQDIDFETTCLTFKSCLETLKAWSVANPGHLPIMVQIEAKDDPIPVPGFPWTVPLPFNADALNEIDATIDEVFTDDQLITPDAVRGGRATLEEAVLKDGWPTLNESRGRFLFTLDNEDAKRDTYIAGHPSLEGRMLFTSSPPGSPESAFVKVNDPIADGAYISSLVAAGYIVRTRADDDTRQARPPADYTMRDAALASGAQFVSTDYIEPNPDFGTGYYVDIPGDDVARCNPVLSPPGCDSSKFEN